MDPARDDLPAQSLCSSSHCSHRGAPSALPEGCSPPRFVLQAGQKEATATKRTLNSSSPLDPVFICFLLLLELLFYSRNVLKGCAPVPRNIKCLKGLSCIKQFIFFLSHYYNETSHCIAVLSLEPFHFNTFHHRGCSALKIHFIPPPLSKKNKEKMRPRGVVLMEAFNLHFSEEIALWDEILFPRSRGCKQARGLLALQLVILAAGGRERWGPQCLFVSVFSPLVAR